ncbi:uncharacterized protein LOC111641236 [Centruroides sculpturatus]|uniref:uncharacterized protein LOC111641236 n=1 Tax=Centruroides sculpturatus TaxID=218467 RepID=UPI000C6EB671|nr:uncharacterized protein LOC111641236 [Centruroides sculpturatus]
MAYNQQEKSTQDTNTNSQQAGNEARCNLNQLSTIKLLQLNAQKSKAACSLLIKTASDIESDIITIQEPYTIDNKIVRFGKWQVLTGQTKNRPKCGIIVCNPNLDIALIPQLCTERICVAIMQQSRPIYIISAYFSPDDNDEGCVNELTKAIKKINSNHIIISGDLNAKSAIWYHKHEDRRGRLVADLMDGHDLVSTNMTTHPTFHTLHAEGWTDVCIVSNDLSQRITNCETLLIPSASDHRYIATHISDIATPLNSNSYLVKRTNWELFRELFGQQWRKFNFIPVNTQEDLDNYVNNITSAIQFAVMRIRALMLIFIDRCL